MKTLQVTYSQSNKQGETKFQFSKTIESKEISNDIKAVQNLAYLCINPLKTMLEMTQKQQQALASIKGSTLKVKLPWAINRPFDVKIVCDGVVLNTADVKIKTGVDASIKLVGAVPCKTAHVMLATALAVLLTDAKVASINAIKKSMDEVDAIATIAYNEKQAEKAIKSEAKKVLNSSSNTPVVVAQVGKKNGAKNARKAKINTAKIEAVETVEA